MSSRSPYPLTRKRPTPVPPDDKVEVFPDLRLLMPIGVQPETLRPWTLVAYNKKVLSGWNALAASCPANARNCYEWLSQHATRIKPRRCYPLKGRKLVGIWGYEIGAGD